MASKANLKTSGREAALARRRALSTGGKSKASAATVERSRSNAPRLRAASDSPNASTPANLASGSSRNQANHSVPAAAVVPESGFGRSGSGRTQSTSYSAPRATGPRTRSPVASAARVRREALSQQGRRAVKMKDRVRADVLTQQLATGTGAARSMGAAASSLRQDRPGAAADLAHAVANTDNNPLSSRSNPASKLLSAKLTSKSGASARTNRRDNGLGAKPTGRLLSLARRTALSGRGKAATNAPTSVASLARQANPKLSGRELAQRVRAQRSHNGGAGERKSAPTGRTRPNSAARGAQDQHWKVGVSETAAGQTVTGTRVGRSFKTTGDEPSTCRAITGTEYMGADIFREFCQTEPPRGVPKVGASPSKLGQRITGNEVGRSSRVTGDEPGSCKRVTGTDYLSPSHFEAFCDLRQNADLVSGSRGPTGLAATQGGQPVSGTQVGRSARVTGDEQGANVKTTGTQYTNAQSIAEGIPSHQIGARSGSASMLSPHSKAVVPPKVAVSSTLSGSQVTGTLVGRSHQVTGDEPGTCRSVTGDQYLSGEQFDSFCTTRPEPEAAKVGESITALGQRVSGTQTGRSQRVTGDEPGTCKAVTGTPYAGIEQTAQYCAPAAQQAARARMTPMARRGAPAMTGQGPGVGGKMTGDARGACEPLTGTPYLGADQQAAACATGAGTGVSRSGARTMAATPDEPDFPQPLTGAPWQQFSVHSPARQADHHRAARSGGVTGTNSESGGQITGPFGMATGKITGTEEFRFGAARQGAQSPPAAPPAAPTTGEQETAAVRAVSRITGEGQSAGLKITGDDWDRGERVTGTEGAWANKRNPTRLGPSSAMVAPERKRNEETPAPVSRVTGSSGNTQRGSLITYSGGARG